MSHYSDNIKKIRKLANKKQLEFASYFPNTTLAMQKSYEQGKAKPDGLYLQILSRLSGISEDKLQNEPIVIEEIDLKLPKEEKDEKGEKEKLFKLSNYEHPLKEESAIDQLTASNKLLAEAAKIQAEANKSLSDAQLILARSHQDLVKLIRPALSTGSDLEGTIEAFGNKLAAFEDVVTSILAKGQKLTVKQIRAALRKAETEISAAEVHEDIHVDEHS